MQIREGSELGHKHKDAGDLTSSLAPLNIKIIYKRFKCFSIFFE